MAFDSADSGSQHSDSSSLVDKLSGEANSLWAQSSERAKMLASSVAKTGLTPLLASEFIHLIFYEIYQLASPPLICG